MSESSSKRIIIGSNANDMEPVTTKHGNAAVRFRGRNRHRVKTAKSSKFDAYLHIFNNSKRFLTHICTIAVFFGDDCKITMRGEKPDYRISDKKIKKKQIYRL